MTTFLSNREIYESVICGMLPQVGRSGFTQQMNVWAAEVIRRQKDFGREIAEGNTENLKEKNR